MITAENPLGGELLPFKTPEELAALVGRKVRYLTPDHIQDMGGKPHFFPDAGIVTAADRSSIQLDNGVSLPVERIKVLAAG
ncbi:hypothetical protein MesoLj131c_61820 [Mesorhizobium sp. 131-3-5]|uniref:hypothetical protein n=1 Tax=Mesorhizobium sp. 131-3-5 TaxID=2744520 RepID=UPI001928E645|nr:hypothetical protein [Mesorhizobium sp. 131-3-5]BCH11924.1 hypothetical protein MesoLj131c_61820 [Mesorhizobium sp. 131-3-5]